jgi:hypothetical protein
VVNVFCAVYAEGVPPDGLEEVYRLHERARGGLERVDPHAAAAVLHGTHRHDHPAPAPAKPKRSATSRKRRTPAAPAELQADVPVPTQVREATG